MLLFRGACADGRLTYAVRRCALCLFRPNQSDVWQFPEQKHPLYSEKVYRVMYPFPSPVVITVSPSLLTVVSITGH